MSPSQINSLRNFLKYHLFPFLCSFLAYKETRRETEGSELPDWYELTDRGGLRFLPGVLAGYMSKNLAAFYGAGTYYFYNHGVYEPREDLAAFAAVRELMIERSAKSAEISDTVSN